MDGTFHTLDEHLDDHPNGRCVMVPCLKGEENAPPGWETGSTWLAKQSEAVQRQVLGNAGYEAYKAGTVKLADFVEQKSDPRWGTMRYARSLSEILGAGEARKWIGRASEAKRARPLSPNPVDQLIRALVRSGQAASTTEVEQITTRMAQAEFPQ